MGSHRNRRRNKQANENEKESGAEFEVEFIEGIRDLEPGKNPEFFVKWKGYPTSNNTWEPLENLHNCIDLVRDFFETNFGEILYSSPSLSPPPSSSSQLMPMITQVPGSESSCDEFVDCESTDLDLAVPSIRPALPLTPALQDFEDIFNQAPGQQIRVENTIDDAAIPSGFTYSDIIEHGKDVIVPDPSFSSSCNCGPDGCDIDNPEPCLCLKEAMMENDFPGIPFEKDGRVAERASKLLWECHSNCTCGPNCLTKASQRGRQFKLKIKRMHDKGWGVILDQDEPIPPRTFVARYTGEIITVEEAEIRGQDQDKLGTTYLFDLDYNQEREAVYCIDAYRKGNESHFFNHSCDPNMSVYMLTSWATGGDTNLMTLSFWSNRTIYRGDELTFDYNGKYVQPWFRKIDEDDLGSDEEEELPKASSFGSRAKLTPCQCGAINCRKWVHL
ncbi:hypothetical protein BGW38_003330 [Lunasporangiospora selenospora]|uniref:Histone-lysine N-methyltransferase n=1 Tax=Lunasporangiospora selenospora TaxID=979761 RepID=A0A9P6FRN6_9FUNG|nr:hypothetical protein BGW38_003330 [Lunasporangiospora selenospora]